MPNDEHKEQALNNTAYSQSVSRIIANPVTSTSDEEMATSSVSRKSTESTSSKIPQKYRRPSAEPKKQAHFNSVTYEDDYDARSSKSGGSMDRTFGTMRPTARKASNSPSRVNSTESRRNVPLQSSRSRTSIDKEWGTLGPPSNKGPDSVSQRSNHSGSRRNLVHSSPKTSRSLSMPPSLSNSPQRSRSKLAETLDSQWQQLREMCPHQVVERFKELLAKEQMKMSFNSSYDLERQNAEEMKAIERLRAELEELQKQLQSLRNNNKIPNTSPNTLQNTKNEKNPESGITVQIIFT